MYIDDPSTPEQTGSTVSTAGWQVEPDQVNNFAAAVAQVRADLNAVFREVDTLSGPSYTPQLGTSPTGQELAQKFNDRLSSETGLRGQLQTALQNLEEFVQSAEKAAATYSETDAASSDKLRQTS